MDKEQHKTALSFAFRKLHEAIKLPKPEIKITLYRGLSGTQMRNVKPDKINLWFSPKDQVK